MNSSASRVNSRIGLVVRICALFVAVTIVAAACGESEGTGSESSSTTPSTTATSTDTASQAVAPGEACATRATMFDLLNRATYQVLAERQTGSGLSYEFFGTAWAIQERLLVTNAHITEAFESVGGLERVVAVQSGTGTVVELLRALTHPDWNGDPLSSADVGLFTTKEPLPARLTLAPNDVTINIGDDILLVGFPGDVDEFLPTDLGVVPQATSLSGQVTARRSHDSTQEVTAETFDYFQHQAPTTPGTSGSAVAICNAVVAVNNAGTVSIVLTPDGQGGVRPERQAAAANNFAVHVKFIRQMVDLFNANSVQGFELPADVVQAPPPTAAPAGPSTFTIDGAVVEGAVHNFTIVIAEDNTISGVSEWPETGQFNLAGQFDPVNGTIVFVDDAPERLDFRRGTYEGVVSADGSIRGVYYEETQEDTQFAWTAVVR